MIACEDVEPPRPRRQPSPEHRESVRKIDEERGDADPDLVSLWLGMTALEAFLVLSRLGNPRLHNGFELYERTRALRG